MKKLVIYHLKLTFLTPRYLMALMSLSLLGLMYNLIPFLSGNGNVSQIRGVYGTSFLFTRNTHIIWLLIILLPLFITFFITELGFNERNFTSILFTRVQRNKFYISKLISHFVLAILLVLSFYLVMVVTNYLMYGFSNFKQDVLLMSYSGTVNVSLINYNEIKDIYFFPSLLLNNVLIYSLVKSVMIALFVGSMSALIYGMSLFIKNNILLHIIPFVFFYLFDMLFQNIFYSCDFYSVLFQGAPQSYPYPIYAYFIMICLFIGLSIGLVVFRDKKDSVE